MLHAVRIAAGIVTIVSLAGSAVAQPGVAGQVQAPGEKLYDPIRDRALGFLAPYGVENFSAQYIDALRTFDAVETMYHARRYQQARVRLDALWSRYPVGHLSWQRLPRQPFGINIGTPPCYYALRMLTDMVDWRLDGGAAVTAPHRTVRLTVVVAGASAGIEPRDLAELNAGGGIPVTHSLDPRVAAGDYRVVHESLRLFEAYVLAMTGGQLGVETEVLSLPDLELAVRAAVLSGSTYLASPVDAGEIWAAIPQALQQETDWWWLVYPSHVPEQYPDFENAEFITGGMGQAPAGGPFFIIDDRWLLRKPPHLGDGDYRNIERRAYLPQWLQHEFYHHLFGRYPELGLEAQPHQWFDRGTWPADFEGRYEADYYHEALVRRLQSAYPPLHVALRYATADAPWDQVQLADVPGDYTRLPVLNAWHNGTIHVQPGGQMRWTNTANVSWDLFPDLSQGVLATGPDCPYYNTPGGRQFRLELNRNADGDWVPTLRGFRFNGELYSRD